MKIEIDPDIRRASTLPARFYRDPEILAELKERVFARSWQLVPEQHGVEQEVNALPWTLLEGFLDEPLLCTTGSTGEQHCLSNVCTHRGNLVVREAQSCSGLRCGYHGRRFGLDGSFHSMPEFEQTVDFPAPSDDLPALPLERFGPLRFTSLDPTHAFAELVEPLRERVGWLPLETFRHDPEGSSEYLVQANWALYCDNYLEGFHIPFVHRALAEQLDYGAYRTETFPLGSLQIGIADPGSVAFDLPPSHPERGQRVAAYYFWLFPNLMLNFYPWGISVNLVEPLGVEQTRVRFLSYVGDAELRDSGAGSGLHEVELEDEAIVEACQSGIRSRLYDRGRYSPTREVGVHHFHRLIARCLSAPGSGSR